MTSLILCLESERLLLPNLIEEFASIKINEPLAGFLVTEVPVHHLTSLLDENWVTEDILNARAEFTYFRRAVMFPNDMEPSFLFLPTSFFNDCRTLYSLPGRQYSPNLIALRSRIRAGHVQTFGFEVWTADHYCSFFKFTIPEIEHGDSMKSFPPSDVLPILRWVLADLSGFNVGAITAGSIDRQSALAGGGSCGIASTNFIESRALGTPRWRANRSAHFRQEMIRDLVLYHLIARKKTTVYWDWVEPCTLIDNGEVASGSDVAVGYSDYNLDMPTAHATHPIYDWLQQVLGQPDISCGASPVVPSTPGNFGPSPSGNNALGPAFEFKKPSALLHLDSISLDPPLDFSLPHMTFDFTSFAAPLSSSPHVNPSRPSTPLCVNPDIIEVSTPPSSAAAPIDLCTPPSQVAIKQEVIDLISPPRPSTPPLRLATKEEVIDLSSPFRPSTKRKHGPSTKLEDATIDLTSPPRSRPKVEPETGPRRVIQSVPGSIRVGAVFDSFSDAESAIFANQEQHGHKWIRGQRKMVDGAMTKRTLRCNHYREPNPIHRIDIDPSDHRQGKSNRTSCMAHININRTGAKCHLTLVDIRHNHEPDIPPGGTAARPPTTEHLRVVSEFSDTFSRQHLKQVLKSQFPASNIEDRQISNMLNKSRREAREQVEVLGGDMRSILASLEEKGWDHSVQMDAENVVTALWWQSPEQKNPHPPLHRYSHQRQCSQSQRQAVSP
ncbi:hypothetical protein C8F04DRAFT_1297965 [Mycena alexandri]|uniref:Uncharacterized protein n=1 Tax=Mycena alexandri TaxID=1745969 RepID=A0AAD6SEW9_9AGAR|nr:hypothetical protein C8F04DRAFT_1297965 [Mycena alexandri]